MLAALEIKLEPIDFEQTVILESPLSPLRLARLGQASLVEVTRAKLSLGAVRPIYWNSNLIWREGGGEGQFVTPLSFDKVITTKI